MTNLGHVMVKNAPSLSSQVCPFPRSTLIFERHINLVDAESLLMWQALQVLQVPALLQKTILSVHLLGLTRHTHIVRVAERA